MPVCVSSRILFVGVMGFQLLAALYNKLSPAEAAGSGKRRKHAVAKLFVLQEKTLFNYKEHQNKGGRRGVRQDRYL